MAKRRIINTKMWSDNWISNLDPVEKLLFFYLLTNERTNLCGLYELPLKIMAVETGIEKEMIEKILKRFSEDKKVFYFEGWILVVNFLKYQERNPSIEAGIKRVLSELPKEILRTAYRLIPDWGESVDIPEPEPEPEPEPKGMNFNKLNSLPIGELRQMLMNNDIEIIEVDGEGNSIEPRKKKAPMNKSAFYLQKVFITAATKELDEKPLWNKKGYFMIVRLLKKGLTVEKLEDCIKDWFNESEPDENLIQITRCLSDNRINRWKMQNK